MTAEIASLLKPKNSLIDCVKIACQTVYLIRGKYATLMEKHARLLRSLRSTLVVACDNAVRMKRSCLSNVMLKRFVALKLENREKINDQAQSYCPAIWQSLGAVLAGIQSPGIVFIKMRRQRLTLHLLFKLLHRRRLNFDRSISMPPDHFQETTRDSVKDMTICHCLTYLAALTAGFHVSCKCRWRFEYFETLQTAMVCSLVAARGQMQLQMIQLGVSFPDDG